MKRQGFTLIEVIIASALFAMVAVIGAATLAATYKVQEQVTLVRTRQETVRSVLELLSRQVRLATAVSVVNDGNNSSITLTNISSDSESTNSSSTLKYFLSNGVLKQQKGTLSNNVFTPSGDSQPVTDNSTFIDKFEVRQTKCANNILPGPLVTNSPVFIHLKVYPKEDDTQTLESSVITTPRAYTGPVVSDCLN